MRVSLVIGVVLLTAAVALAADGCGSFTGTDGTAAPGADAGDVADDAAPAPGAVLVDPDGGASYAASLSDKTKWEAVNLSMFVAKATGFRGGTFDGHYMYLAPDTGTNFLRFDTRGSFSSSGSWTAHDLGPTAREYFGMGFDGRFVYASPFDDDNGSAMGTLVRYDTMLDFEMPTSWDSYNLGAGRFIGVGRGSDHMFLSPRGGPSIAVLAAGASPDGGLTLASAGSPRLGYRGGVFANGYYYLAPFQQNDESAPSGNVLRFADSKAAFDPASAESFDYSAKSGNQSTRGFGGAVTDGRYVYFVPFLAAAYLGVVLRYDTTLPFNNVDSYAVFNITVALGQKTARGFIGSAFDGRFIYFVPAMDDTETNTFVVRYDTRSGFNTIASWQLFDLHGVDVKAGGYWGAVFDGEYVYLAPYSKTVMLRFHARTPSALPPPFSGAP